MANNGMMMLGCGRRRSAGGVVVPALDLDFDSATYGTINWAYSVRKIVSTYTGPSLRVRRSSDDAEQDIEFGSDGYLDEASLLSFCAGTNGYVVTFYNQSDRGSVADCTNATASLQPIIVSAGAAQETTPSGHICPFFSADLLESSATGWSPTSAISCRYAVTKCRSTPSSHWLKIFNSSAGQCDWQFRTNANIIRQFYLNGAHDFGGITMFDDWKAMAAMKGTTILSRQNVNGATSSGTTGQQPPTSVRLGQWTSNYPGQNDLPEIFCFTGVEHTFDQMALLVAFMNDYFEAY